MTKIMEMLQMHFDLLILELSSKLRGPMSSNLSERTVPKKLWKCLQKLKIDIQGKVYIVLFNRSSNYFD